MQQIPLQIASRLSSHTFERGHYWGASKMALQEYYIYNVTYSKCTADSQCHF